MRDGGIEIIPLSTSSKQFTEQSRPQVVSAAILDVVQKLNISANLIKTIFIDLK